MKKMKQIIETENYVLSVSDEEIKIGDYFINGNIDAKNHNICLATKENVEAIKEIAIIMSSDIFPKNVITKKIISYRPKGNKIKNNVSIIKRNSLFKQRK
jgi:hypothetical protein